MSFVLDGGPKVASVVLDERLDDGGEEPQGWVFFPAGLGEVGGAALRIESPAVARFVLHERALLTGEAIAAARALR